MILCWPGEPYVELAVRPTRFRPLLVYRLRVQEQWHVAIRPIRWNRWWHIACQGPEARLGLFVEGEPVEARPAPVGREPPPASRVAVVGAAWEGSGLARHWHGRLGPMRFSRGIQYHAPFVPPATLVRDSKTVALFLLDHPVADTLYDTSGHGNHATTYLVQWSLGVGRP